MRQARIFDRRADINHATDILNWCNGSMNQYGFILANLYGYFQVNDGDVVVQYEDKHFEMCDGHLWSEQNTELEPA